MGDIHDDLRDVMGLLGKATPGTVRAMRRNGMLRDSTRYHLFDGRMHLLATMSGSMKKADEYEANAQAIAAAVNFLRQHGPALLARQEGEDDSARLDYIERTFSGMTNRERYLPVQMIWGKGANGRSLREACDKYMAAEAARSGGGG